MRVTEAQKASAEADFFAKQKAADAELYAKRGRRQRGLWLWPTSRTGISRPSSGPLEAIILPDGLLDDGPLNVPADCQDK
ncbi:hypothetical protein CRG98_042705 [Punica granatum]|nr:hypothetical protein CRG98_042705 [Punica granatum]